MNGRTLTVGLVAVLLTFDGIALVSNAHQPLLALADDKPTTQKDPGHKHEHKDSKHDEHNGKKEELGEKDIAGFKVKITQYGEVKGGSQTVFVCMISGKGEPKAVRAWVGNEKPGDSGKEKAEEEKEGEWHAHIDVPEKLPEKSKLWVELETDSGKTVASYDYK